MNLDKMKKKIDNSLGYVTSKKENHKVETVNKTSSSKNKELPQNCPVKGSKSFILKRIVPAFKLSKS